MLGAQGLGACQTGCAHLLRASRRTRFLTPEGNLMRSIASAATFVLVCASCAAPAPTPEAPPTDPAAERAAVERAITQWFDSGIAPGDSAVMRRGLTATAAILEDSVWYDRAGFIDFVVGFPKVVGSPYTMRFALSDWRTTVEGDVAWTSLRNRAVLTPEKGKPMNFDWRETAILTRVDGAWLIDRYHSAPVR
jgi:hypothetical protein